jgi:hypothetical protein
LNIQRNRRRPESDRLKARLSWLGRVPEVDGRRLSKLDTEVVSLGNTPGRETGRTPKGVIAVVTIVRAVVH